MDKTKSITPFLKRKLGHQKRLEELLAKEQLREKTKAERETNKEERALELKVKERKRKLATRQKITPEILKARRQFREDQIKCLILESFKGKKIGMLQPIAEADHREKNGARIFICKCDCGNTGYFKARYLYSKNNGNKHNCGCVVYKETLGKEQVFR